MYIELADQSWNSTCLVLMSEYHSLADERLYTRLGGPPVSLGGPVHLGAHPKIRPCLQMFSVIIDVFIPLIYAQPFTFFSVRR